jgi:hypothetical protein
VSECPSRVDSVEKAVEKASRKQIEVGLLISESQPIVNCLSIQRIVAHRTHTGGYDGVITGCQSAGVSSPPLAVDPPRRRRRYPRGDSVSQQRRR